MINYVFDFFVIIVLGLMIYKYISIFKAIKSLKNRDNVLDLSGCEIASKILENSNLENIYVVETKNPFEEGYDVNRKVIKLSKEQFNSTSISDMLLVSRLCSRILLSRKDKLINFKYWVINILDIISIISLFALITCSVLKDLYYLKISIIVLIISIIIRLLFIPLEKEINKKALTELNKLNLIDENNNDKINNLFDELSFSVVVKPIILIISLIKYLNNKMK